MFSYYQTAPWDLTAGTPELARSSAWREICVLSGDV
jgi:hypothetical protein